MKNRWIWLLTALLLVAVLSGCSGEVTSGYAQYKQTPYERGNLTEEGWESEWLGLRFALPEGLVLSTEDEMQQQLQERAASMGTQAEETSVVYEFIANDTDRLRGISVTMYVQHNVADVDPLGALEITKAQMDAFNELGIGIYYDVDEVKEAKLGDVEFLLMSASIDQGVVVYLDTYCLQKGDSLVFVAVQTYEDNARKLVQKAFAEF